MSFFTNFFAKLIANHILEKETQAARAMQQSEQKKQSVLQLGFSSEKNTLEKKINELNYSLTKTKSDLDNVNNQRADLLKAYQSLETSKKTEIESFLNPWQKR